MSIAFSRRAFMAGAALAATTLATCITTTGCAKEAPQDAPSDAADNADVATEAADAGNPSTAQPAIARPSTCGRLAVAEGRLVDASGNPVQLKGFSTHGLAWFPQYVNAECFSELAGWGANLARLALYTDENGGWCAGGDRATLADVVDRGVRYAADADMYAIVDWHVLHDLNPNRHLDAAKAFWDETSQRYAACEHVIYEICNEPNGSTTWDDVKSYAEEIIPIIRARDPAAVILVGTPTWSQDIDKAAASPLQGLDNVMYTLHFYAATHKDDLRNRLRTAAEGGLPVFISEYGICDASGNGAIDEESADAWMALADELGISSACWNLSNKAESSSIIAASCDKTSGFEASDLSACGTWFQSMLKAFATGGAATLPAENEARPVATGNAPTVTASDGIECAISLRQTWEKDGAQVNLYDLIIKNPGQAAVSGWSVDLAFNGEITVTDSWNASASQDGSAVHLSPESYNRNIAAGESILDVGLIVQMR